MSIAAASTLLLCSSGNARHSNSPAAWSLPGTTSKTRDALMSVAIET